MEHSLSGSCAILIVIVINCSQVQTLETNQLRFKSRSCYSRAIFLCSAFFLASCGP